MKKQKLTIEDLLASLPEKIRKGFEKEPERDCFTCEHYRERIDEHICWASGEPENINIREHCILWEEEE